MYRSVSGRTMSNAIRDSLGTRIEGCKKNLETFGDIFKSVRCSENSIIEFDFEGDNLVIFMKRKNLFLLAGSTLVCASILTFFYKFIT